MTPQEEWDAVFSVFAKVVDMLESRYGGQGDMQYWLSVAFTTPPKNKNERRTKAAKAIYKRIVELVSAEATDDTE